MAHVDELRTQGAISALLIGHDDDIGSGCSMVFEDRGHRLAFAVDLADGLARAAADPPDVVILNWAPSLRLAGACASWEGALRLTLERTGLPVVAWCVPARPDVATRAPAEGASAHVNLLSFDELIDACLAATRPPPAG